MCVCVGGVCVCRVCVCFVERCVCRVCVCYVERCVYRTYYIVVNTKQGDTRQLPQNWRHLQHNEPFFISTFTTQNLPNNFY